MKKTSLLAVAFSALVCNAQARSCIPEKSLAQANLTVPLMVQMPSQSGTAAIGSVLYVKEASLAQFTGSHRPLNPGCLNAIGQNLSGRMAAHQSGKNVYDTSLPGVGLRFTVIIDKPGIARKEWVLPFAAAPFEEARGSLSTDDLKLRIEVIKTGIIQGGSINIQLPSLLAMSDRSLVVNLVMRLQTAKAHCAITVNQPQITLPPIDVARFNSHDAMENYPVAVKLQCLNTRQASINIEGLMDANKNSIFRNVAPDNPANGVGIEMLYNGNVMLPNYPVDMTIPSQQFNVALPLAVRYAKTNQPVGKGNVKAQITLRINYL